MIRNIIGFALVLLLAAILWQAGLSPMTPLPQILAALTIAVIFVHAVLALGWRNAIGFAAIVLAVTFAVENIGAATGFPFGRYHFVVGTELPHVGRIPIIVGPLYFGVGYGAYVIAVLIARDGRATPLIAAIAMTVWDLAMDSVNSTLEGLWAWHDGGRYFGVPLSNFAGWFFEMLIVFATVRIFLRWRGAVFDFSTRSFWLVPILLYLAAGLSQVAPWLTAGDAQVLDAAGHVWSALAIHRAAVLVAVLGMAPLAGLALWRLRGFNHGV